MTCEQIRDRLEEYVLGQLGTAERLEVERHLATCQECRAELATLEALLSRFPDAVADRALSASESEQILQQIHDQIYDENEASVRQMAGASRWRGWLSPARVAAAIMLVALVTSVGWSLRLNQALSEERQLRAQIDQLVDQQEIVLEIVDGPDTERRLLRPQSDEFATSYGKVFTRPEFTDVVIMTGRLPDPPAGRAYLVWLTSNDDVELAGPLDVNADGFGLLVIEADDAGPVYQSALVTLQPPDASAPGGVTVLIWTP